MHRFLNAITPTIDCGKWETCFPFERRGSLLVYLQAVLGVRIIARAQSSAGFVSDAVFQHGRVRHDKRRVSCSLKQPPTSRQETST